MTIKEKIVEMMQRAGYDFMTACEEAERMIQEFRRSSRLQSRYFIKGGGAFTVRKG